MKWHNWSWLWLAWGSAEWGWHHPSILDLIKCWNTPCRHTLSIKGARVTTLLLWEEKSFLAINHLLVKPDWIALCVYVLSAKGTCKGKIKCCTCITSMLCFLSICVWHWASDNKTNLRLLQLVGPLSGSGYWSSHCAFCAEFIPKATENTFATLCVNKWQH